jgi:stage II sporulation protein M
MKRKLIKNLKNDNAILISIALFGIFLLFISSIIGQFFIQPSVEFMVLQIYGFSFAYFGMLGYFLLNDKGNYSRGWKFLKESKYFIIFAVFLFIILIVAGYFIEIGFITEIIQNTIRDLIDKTSNLNFIEMLWFIFYNNSSVAFMSIMLGTLFSIFPLITTIFNGYVIGFVLKKSIEAEGPLIAFRLLPHGIFELPAIIISIALGIRIGMFVFSKYPGKTFKYYFINSIRILVFIIIPLLVIAAIIETGLIFFLK